MSILEQVSDVLFGHNRGLFGTATPAKGETPEIPALMVIPNVVIDEGHDDQIVITDHPVEIGAEISDHWYARPSQLKLRYGWSPGAPYFGGLLGAAIPLAAGVVSGFNQIFNGGDDYLTGVYKNLLAAQRSGKTFKIVTGKRVYTDMMIQAVSFETSKRTEYSMIVSIVCRQVIIVRVKTFNTASQEQMLNPQQTAPVQDAGTKVPAATNDSSLLKKLGGAIGGFLGI